MGKKNSKKRNVRAVKTIRYCVGNMLGIPIFIEHHLFEEDVEMVQKACASRSREKNSIVKMRNKIQNKGNRNH